MEQLAKGVYYLPLGFSNAYLIQGKDGMTLVDTGLANSQKKIEKHLAERNFTLLDIQRILITHAHPDHLGSAALLRDECRAKLWISKGDAPYAQGDKTLNELYPTYSNLPLKDKAFRTLARRNLTRLVIDKKLSYDEVLDEVRTGFQVVHLPGHTPGQIGLWLASEGLLIGADVMMRFARLSMPIRAFSSDWELAKASVEKVRDMKVKTLGLGHGRPFIGDADLHIEKLAKRMKLLQE